MSMFEVERKRKRACSLGGRRTERVDEEEISRLSRRQSPFGLQHSGGGQLPTAAEAALAFP